MLVVNFQEHGYCGFVPDVGEAQFSVSSCDAL